MNKYNFFISSIFIVLLFTFTFIVLGNLFLIKTNETMLNLNYGILLENNIKDKDLNLIFPNYEGLKFDDKLKNDIDKNILNEDFLTFQKTLQDNYLYSSDYDCKYWSYVWLEYYKFNKDKYNWKLKITTTQNHIFLIVYNNSGYCILDETNVDCNMVN